MSFSPDPYLSGLLAEDPQIMKLIYTDFARRIEVMVAQNGGSKEDSRDVFQEALIIIWRKAERPDFKLTSGFYTYLYSVCYYTWVRKREKKDNNTVTITGTEGLENDTSIQEELETSERHQLFKQHFAALGSECKRLISLFWRGTKMKEIAKLMNIENEHAVRNRKYRCQKKLEEHIKNDPRHVELRYLP